MANNVVLSSNEISNFFNNSAEHYGGAIYASHNTVLTFSGNNKFFNNHVLNSFGDGGAIHASHSTVLTFSGNNKFFNNHVNTMGDGGAIYTSHNAVLTFSGISNIYLVAHPFCSAGSSTGLLAPCLQTNSVNRNAQWPSVLCQHCWSKQQHLSTSEIY